MELVSDGFCCLLLQPLLHYLHVRVYRQHLHVPGQELCGGDEGGKVIPQSLEASLLSNVGPGLCHPDRRRVVSPAKLFIDPGVNAVERQTSILEETVQLKKMLF